MENGYRLIDANDLIERLKFKKKISEVGLHRGLQSAMSQCDKAPTVDAVEVVHGRWVVLAEFVDGYTCASCSVCGEYTYKKGQKGPFRVEYAKYNYCPNCGAKMDGGNEDV